MTFHRTLLILTIFSCLLNLVLLTDFLLPQKEKKETIIRKGAEEQKALGQRGLNRYNVCRIKTSSGDFYAENYFCYSIHGHDSIRIWQSPIFENITAYSELDSPKAKETYSLVKFSFLYFPVFFVVAAVIGWRWNNFNNSIFLLIVFIGSLINFFGWAT